MQETQVWSLIRETKIPHAAQQLSPHATTTEPAPSRYGQREARVPQLRPDTAKLIPYI